MRIHQTSLLLVLGFAGAFNVCIAAGPANAQADHGTAPSPEQSALARDTCINVMRIPRGFVPFDACVESLSQTLKDKRAASKEIPAGYATDRPGETSYSESDLKERRRREEYSCARLGVPRGSPGFGQCVAELDGALRSVEHSD